MAHRDTGSANAHPSAHADSNACPTNGNSSAGNQSCRSADDYKYASPNSYSRAN